MGMTLAQCARCKSMYSKLKSPICPECQPAEESDYERIRDVLADRPNLKADVLAEAAGVEIDCVLRMMEQGFLASDEVTTDLKCGRCGRPAISMSKRLCQACMAQLDVEISRSVNMARKQIKETAGDQVRVLINQKRKTP